MGVEVPSNPINRKEQYLAKIAGQAVEIPAEPITREEAYLDYIAKHGGGGGGGTNDYDDLLNQPKINDVTLKGNKSAENLGLASKTAVDNILNGVDIDSFGDVESALTDKANVSDVKKEFGGTLDQWNALTTEEKKEYDTYDITDDYSDGNYIYLPTIYSEEEREVGVWKDGKPLYQKLMNFDFTVNTNVWTLFDDSVPYDTLVGVIPKMKALTASEEQLMLYGDSDTSPRWCVMNDHKLYYYVTNQPRKGYVILQYTKTTDTAGSGTWTPTGEYAEHYSTDEQIIGTWIDGSTLYERTWDLGSDVTLTAGQWVNMSQYITIPNCDKMISVGSGISSDGVASTLESAYNAGYLELRHIQFNGVVRYVTLQYTKTA